jgi:hypothetical protein
VILNSPFLPLGISNYVSRLVLHGAFMSCGPVGVVVAGLSSAVMVRSNARYGVRISSSPLWSWLTLSRPTFSGSFHVDVPKLHKTAWRESESLVVRGDVPGSLL